MNEKTAIYEVASILLRLPCEERDKVSKDLIDLIKEIYSMFGEGA